jgi:serine/threonine protein phosphatase PrpC
VVVVVAQGDRFACLWAGDSRVYRLSDDRLVQITRDHSLVQDLVDAGEIDPADARTHPNANVVMRAVGARPEIVIDQVDGALLPSDMLLLASDGLGRVVEDEELAAEMAAPSVTAAADRLIEMTLERGAPDNVSVVIVRAGR